MSTAHSNLELFLLGFSNNIDKMQMSANILVAMYNV